MSYSDNLGFLNNSRYCGNCENLSCTEEEQQAALYDEEHYCYKFEEKLYHKEFDRKGEVIKDHSPKILKCEKCLNKDSK